MRTLFTYGGGIPRYLGLWLVLTPVLVVGLVWLRTARVAIVALVLTTVPQLVHHDPPTWMGPVLRWTLATAALAGLVAFLVARVRWGDDRVDEAVARPTRAVVLALIGLALAIRIPLAWWDPGISDIATSNEVAADQLVHGKNPWVERNEPSVIGEYQYPAGSALAYSPFVAVVPDSVAGERHLGARATLWATDAAAVALLATAAGPAAGFAYAVAPPLVRDSGLTVANDLILSLFVAAAAVALHRRRLLVGGALVGLAISVKPAAVVVLPVLLVGFGWGPALAAVAVPALVQLPWLLFPTVGLHGLGAIAEPVGRSAPYGVLQQSTWWPAFAALGHGTAAVKAAAAANLAVSMVVGAWAGLRLRLRATGGGGLGRVAAACALPLLVSFALAPIPHLNYEGWYLAPFVLTAALVPVRRRVAVAA